MRAIRRNPLAAFVIVIAAAVAAVAGWYWLAGPGRSGGEAGAVLMQLSGRGSANSESFVARDGWQIHWQTEGTRFQISIDGDVDIGVAVEQAGPGSGITTPVPTGTFSLSVDAEGPWMLEVTQGN